MGFFDNGKSVVFNNKEVVSIKIGNSVLYEKTKSPNPNNDLIIQFTGTEFSTKTISLYEYSWVTRYNEEDSPVFVDWDDGHFDEFDDGTEDISYTYEVYDTYTIRMSGFDEINDGAFSHFNEVDNKITSVIIPSSIEYIGSECFAYNPYLESVTFEGINPPALNTRVFAECPNLATIYIPQGALSNYTVKSEYFPNNSTFVEY